MEYTERYKAVMTATSKMECEYRCEEAQQGRLTLVLGIRLDTCLGGVREQTTGHSEKEFGADDTSVGAMATPTAVVDEKAKCNGEEDCSSDDENLQTPHEAHNDTNEQASQDRNEAVQR